MLLAMDFFMAKYAAARAWAHDERVQTKLFQRQPNRDNGR